MVGWHLLLLLAVETALYGTTGRYLHVHHGWSAVAATALAIALYVGIRAVIIAAQFLFARWQGDPIPASSRVSVRRLLLMYLRELAGWLLMYSLMMPFVPSRGSVLNRPVDRLAGRFPVLLIHGLACNRGNWFWFRRRLEAQGYAVFAVDLTPPFTHIDKFAPQLARAIDEILQASCAGKVVLVGHSMGGLVARAYLNQFGPAKVEHVITLGSPHHGTWMTRFAAGPNLRDMDLNSTWLSALHEDEAMRSSNPYANFTCVYTLHDNLVSPQTSASLPGAAKIVMSGIGHLSLVLSAVVAARLAPVLERVSRPSGKEPGGSVQRQSHETGWTSDALR